MKKRGFTLIELLAVIVILAIIVLIAAPVVVDIIGDSKKDGIINGASLYLKAVDLAIAEKNKEEGLMPEGTFDLDENGNVCFDQNCDDKLVVKTTGSIPKGGVITIENSSVTDVELVYEGATVVLNDRGVPEFADESSVSTPSECFTYLDNYDYTINKDVCMYAFEEKADEFFGSGAGALICSGDKTYGDLISIAKAAGYSKEQLEQNGVITIDEQNQGGNGTVSIIGYTCGETNKEVVIPKKIDGKLVSAIGIEAFYAKQLTSVVIPNSVTSIEPYAFANNQLTKVIIKGKSGASDFATYGSSAFGWAEGYSDTNITWQQ